MAFPNTPSDGETYDKWYFDSDSVEWKLTASLKDPLWVENLDASIHYSQGNVGIGIDNPSEKLSVWGSGSPTSVYVYDGTGSTAGRITSDGDILDISARGSSNSKLTVTTGAGSGSTALTIDAAGKVGIGISSPSGILHLKEGTGRIIFKTDAVTSGYNSLIEQTDTGLEFTAQSNGRGFVFNTGSTPTPKLTIDATGNATFSGTVTANLLAVGNKRIYDTASGGIGLYMDGGTDAILPIDNAGNLKSAGPDLGNTSRKFKGAHFSGTVNAGAVTATGDVTAFSDVAYKEEINPIMGALDKVNQIGGYTFKRKDDDSRKYTGVLAQEIQEVLPEAVHSSEQGLSVAYGNLTGLLIEAVKELTDKVKELENK